MFNKFKKKRRIAESLAKFYLRYGRGNELTSFLLNTMKLTVYLGGLWYLIKAWFDIDFSKWFAIIFSVIYVIVCYFIGYLDEFWGFWKVQVNYSSKQLNPFFEEMNKDIKEIKDKLKCRKPQLPQLL